MDAAYTDRNLPLGLAVADLREADVLRIVVERMERGDDPARLIEECQEGMRLVGERYSQRRYYLSGLIMAGDILRQVMELVQPGLEEHFSGSASACLLVGTVQGDIHDLGKSVFEMLARSHGFTVHDLGVDVPPERFAEECRNLRPDIVGLSGLLTASYDPMRETVALLRAQTAPGSAPVPVIIGGQVDGQVCRYVEADGFTTDAMHGVRLCQQLVGSPAAD